MTGGRAGGRVGGWTPWTIYCIYMNDNYDYGDDDGGGGGGETTNDANSTG
jgi:hypothetical protein